MNLYGFFILHVSIAVEQGFRGDARNIEKELQTRALKETVD